MIKCLINGPKVIDWFAIQLIFVRRLLSLPSVDRRYGAETIMQLVRKYRALWLGKTCVRANRFCFSFQGCAVVLMGLLLAACDPYADGPSYQPAYASQSPGQPVQQQIRVGIHPLHNPELLFERYGPVVDALNQRIPDAHFVLEASRNYEEFENKLLNGSLELALPNPYQTLVAMGQGYRVFGKMADDSVFRGLVLVRKDSHIDSAGALRGQSVSFPSATALAATMLPQYALQQAGLEWGSYQARYVGSQESSIMNVLLAHTQAGATWPAPWTAFQQNFPERAAQLQVLLETPSLINNAWVAREDVTDERVQQVGHVLFSLHETPEGRAILAALPLERFEPAGNTDYAQVGEFIREFSRTVRPVEP